MFGPKEDEFYCYYPLLIKNVRRGNTLLRKDGKTIMARKGLMKYFDLRLPYIQNETRDELENRKYKEQWYQEKNYIMAPLLKAIADGYQVEVFKTLKANGENLQISYSHFI